MKTILTISAAALLIAGSASAQVLGGVGGQVSGQVGVGAQRPSAGVGSTLRGAGDLTRDTIRDGRGVARDVRPDVRASVNTDVRTNTRISRNQADVNAALRTGAMVHASDGGMVGSVVNVTRNSAGRATAFTVRTASGATRTLRPGSVGVRGDVLIMTSR